MLVALLLQTCVMHDLQETSPRRLTICFSSSALPVFAPATKLIVSVFRILLYTLWVSCARYQK